MQWNYFDLNDHFLEYYVTTMYKQISFAYVLSETYKNIVINKD